MIRTDSKDPLNETNHGSIFLIRSDMFRRFLWLILVQKSLLQSFFFFWNALLYLRLSLFLDISGHREFFASLPGLETVDASESKSNKLSAWSLTSDLHRFLCIPKTCWMLTIQPCGYCIILNPIDDSNPSPVDRQSSHTYYLPDVFPV